MAPLEGFGQALRSLRTRAGLRQEEVDDRAGISRGNMSRYETGKKWPSMGTLGKVLEVLGADLGDLGDAARAAVTGITTGATVQAASADPRIALIDRYAREIGLDALAEVARRERGALVEAAVRRLDPTNTGGGRE